MPRYRKLHTKTVESLDINDMPDDFTRLFWVLLPLALCSEGRGIHNPAWLKSRLFPLRTDITQDTVAEAFDWFISRGMVVPYSVGGRDYFYVPTFHRYQGNTTKEADSDYPPPPEQETSQVPTCSGPTPDLVQTKSASDAVFNIQYSNADATATAPAQEQRGTDPAVADDSPYELLVAYNVEEPSLSVCAQYPASLVRAWIEVAKRAKGADNPQGIAVNGIKSGKMPKARAPADPATERKRKYARPGVQT